MVVGIFGEGSITSFWARDPSYLGEANYSKRHWARGKQRLNKRRFMAKWFNNSMWYHHVASRLRSIESGDHGMVKEQNGIRWNTKFVKLVCIVCLVCDPFPSSWGVLWEVVGMAQVVHVGRGTVRWHHHCWILAVRSHPPCNVDCFGCLFWTHILRQVSNMAGNVKGTQSDSRKLFDRCCFPIVYPKKAIQLVTVTVTYNNTLLIT